MRREEVCIGVFVRLLSDWLDIPKGTVGTIDLVETLPNGSWYFTVFWKPHRPLPRLKGRPSTPRKTGFQSGSFGLRLWEEDLPRFEIISQEEKDAALLTIVRLLRRKPRRSLFLTPRHYSNQLSLPF